MLEFTRIKDIAVYDTPMVTNFAIIQFLMGGSSANVSYLVSIRPTSVLSSDVQVLGVSSYGETRTT